MSVSAENQSLRQPQAPSVPQETVNFLRWLFGFHVLTIRQKIMAIAQKYYVMDESGQPRFFVVRPPHLFMSFVSGIAGMGISILALIYAFRFLFYQQEYVLAFATFIIGGWVASITRLLLAPYRDIKVCTDESERFLVLFITQDNKIGLWRYFTVYDATGQVVATLKRSSLRAIWRREWHAETPNGQLICKVREDTLALSLLRRYLGPLLGVLRTNFIFETGDKQVFGEFNRQFTIRDTYLLDMRRDPAYLIDRRVALAMGILLDTAESR